MVAVATASTTATPTAARAAAVTTRAIAVAATALLFWSGASLLSDEARSRWSTLLTDLSRSVEQKRKATFRRSVDPNQSRLLLVVQPAGGINLQKRWDIRDARTPTKILRHNHADCVGADVAFRCDGRPEISNSGAGGVGTGCSIRDASLIIWLAGHGT